MNRSLVYKDEKSDKFWNIEVNGMSFTVTYGKSGTAGSTNTKTFGSEAECGKEAQKLIQEKIKKGYNDAAETEPQNMVKFNVKLGILELPVSNFAKKMQHPTFETFEPKDLIRFQKGFPEMVELLDKHPHNKSWEKWVAEAAGGIDPTYETEWPSRVALAYAHTYPIHPGFDATGNISVPQNKDFLKSWQNTEAPTIETLRLMLKRFLPGDEVYSSWKAPAAFYIFEHYLGAEAVAMAILERFEAYSDKQWKTTSADKDYHTNIAIEVLDYLMLRASDEAHERIHKALKQLMSKRQDGNLFNLLAKLPSKPKNESPLKTEDDLKYLDVRSLFLYGADYLMKADLEPMKDLRKMVLQRWIDQIGRIKHPGAARVILSFGRFRAVVKDVKAWKEKHADYLNSIMHFIENDPLVIKGLQGLEGKVVEQKTISADKAWELTEKQYDKLRKSLKAMIKSKTLSQENLNSKFQEVVDESREIARSAGEDYLELFFVNLWPEADWDDFPEEVFDMLNNAYDEVVC